MIPEQRCGNCKFSRMHAEEGSSWLACHAHAPTTEGWYPVEVEDWCGEWVRQAIPIRRPDLSEVRDPSGPAR